MSTEPILQVNNLKKYFKTPRGMLHAVDDVTFNIMPGRTLGVVGESGCGKTTIGRTILRLTEPTSGSVVFDGVDICKLNKREMRAMRKNMQIIFQDPYSSIDPRVTVAQAIEEPIKLNKLEPIAGKRKQRVAELMELVGLSERLADSYPHELDGGRRQRVGIARALAMNPKFIICDEPVSALDVSIQAQILNLLEDLQEKLGLTYIFITHDLSVVSHFSDDIMVMYLGRMLEKAPADELFENPMHPYTQSLLSAVPLPTLKKKMNRIILEGEITSPIDPPNACRFAGRCRFATEKCFQNEPPMKEVSEGHFVSCFMAEENISCIKKG